MANPRVAISTRTSPILSLSKWREVCEQTGIDSIDLDVANPVRRRLALRGLGRNSPAVFEFQSVWIGNEYPDRLSNVLPANTLIVVPFERLLSGRSSKSVDPKQLDKLQLEITGSKRIAIALTAVNHEGTRTHLDRISAIRHVAEEWDFDVALDLTSTIDPRWEAEAAVLRLGERLRLVRLTPPRFEPDRFWGDSHHAREVTTARVLSALADFGLTSTLSFKVPPSIWNWANPVAISGELSIAVAATLAKFHVKTSSIITPPKRVI
jgi:hypothetical protein